MILLRAKVPDVFRYGHETLFFTPLAGILAGGAIIEALKRGGVMRGLAVVFGIALAAFSLLEQSRAVAEQLANAL